MDEFIEWYCSELRLALNRGIVLRYRLQLEAKKLAASTINVRLAAVRRLAYEAADTGLLSPELVAGIRRVKGVPQLGRRVGNWLSAAEGEPLLSGFGTQTLRDKRDLAIISLLLGCGLRRSEVVALKVSDIQRREDHWAIIDLVGKAGHRGVTGFDRKDTKDRNKAVTNCLDTGMNAYRERIPRVEGAGGPARPLSRGHPHPDISKWFTAHLP